MFLGILQKNASVVCGPTLLASLSRPNSASIPVYILAIGEGFCLKTFILSANRSFLGPVNHPGRFGLLGDGFGQTVFVICDPQLEQLLFLSLFPVGAEFSSLLPRCRQSLSTLN